MQRANVEQRPSLVLLVPVSPVPVAAQSKSSCRHTEQGTKHVRSIYLSLSRNSTAPPSVLPALWRVEYRSCLSRLSTRQRVDLVRRCGEAPKVGNSSLSSYRKLSFWLPSALALSGSTAGGAAFGSTATVAIGGVGARVGGMDGRERRAAMFRNRSLRQRLSEACEAVMESEAVMGSTSSRRERGLRRLFASSGTGAGGRGRAHGFLSSTTNSVILIVGIFAAMLAYQRYVKV